MRRICCFSLFLWLAISFVIPVQAADVLHRLTHDDQDTLLIGQVIRNEKAKMSIQVIYIVSGEQTEQEITIACTRQEDNCYELNLGDIALFSLDQEDSSSGNYHIKWGIYPLDISDGLAHLKGAQEEPMIAALQYYVNSGGRPASFVMEGDRMQGRYDNGEIVHIAPKLDLAARQHTKDGLGQLIRPLEYDHRVVQLKDMDQVENHCIRVIWIVAEMLGFLIVGSLILGKR
ncbi:hypothetical protein M5X00_10435 [Paenibacillus alvei]|uniref:Transmembrane protein n=1 Tax=Paenibacillus alvei TaxID=44250 RepID=A0ABT4GTF8_PAEAL|nr:hypothetical protein [Paenibacillus alvei]EJW17888.1 hypothetical protein PAV_3c03370 [Paenibacillus alvei DSM 29]MCY9544386.1 hypothetical protein [Paenibacillus alvei]MCY9703394.1 hypothetical protein [Paenibacillus alvei]MCY9738278.1 hypothetical protein [Paenibacillus alvei]MCY9754667.1 hypothetical protein [Paenibacillus alvei]